ncbi:protein PBDC1-like [Paramacrobiotus metropolitanus]|uniref:protein PBDC1-like n=1 Tax=Paramacrobiotus metropolitanus TaxID=2943436 RepID=UPI002445699D|nr:protein PBDC1-like [Paramacrobiotus metropolitanus]
MDLKDLSLDAARSIAFCLSEPAEKYENDPEVEFLWAMKAMEHAEVHFNLVSSVDPRRLRLTDHDDRLYTDFKKSFPDFHLSPLVIEELKSDEAKEKWRTFMKEYENDVADFNYATLLRIDANQDYSETNTIVVPRVQFVVLEVARNREGFNDELRAKYGKKEA